MTRTFDGEIWLDCPADECVDGSVHVAYRVHPGEEAVRYPNRKAYPGAPPSAEIVEILERVDCDPPHDDLTNRDVDQMEASSQSEMIRAAGAERRRRREDYDERKMRRFQDLTDPGRP